MSSYVALLCVVGLYVPSLGQIVSCDTFHRPQSFFIALSLWETSPCGPIAKLENLNFGLIEADYVHVYSLTCTLYQNGHHPM